MDQMSDATTDPTVGTTAAATDSGPLPVDLRDWVRFSTSAATRVRVQTSAHLAVDLWCIEPQQATEVLMSGNDISYTVIGGRSWFVTDAGDIGLDPLGSMLVPAGTAHGIDNRAPDPLIVLAVSSPPVTAPADAPVSADGRAVRDDAAAGARLRGLVARLRRSGADTDGPSAAPTTIV
jgi:quercetin dioxygenase-like cupin family protein